jgi:hypothetical protein
MLSPTRFGSSGAPRPDHPAKTKIERSGPPSLDAFLLPDLFLSFLFFSGI